MIRKSIRGIVASDAQPFQPRRRQFLRTSALGVACMASAPLLASSDLVSSGLVDAFGHPLTNVRNVRSDQGEAWARAMRELLLLYLKLLPEGGILSHLAALFIPIPGVSAEQLWMTIIDARISDALFRIVRQDLVGLTDIVTLYRNAVTSGDPEEIRETSIAVNVYFTGSLPGFQLPGEEVPLLPLFAMGATMHLSLLRDIVLKGRELGFSDASISNYREELKRRIDSYTQYVDTHVAAGIDKARRDNPNIGTPLTRNQPLSAMLQTKAALQVGVLDMRDTWYAFDATTFPEGTTVKLNREILSPIAGWWDGQSTAPSEIPIWNPPTDPLILIKVWNQSQWRTSFLAGFSLEYDNDDPPLETGRQLGQQLTGQFRNADIVAVEGYYSAGIFNMIFRTAPDREAIQFGRDREDVTESRYISEYADHRLSSIRSIGEGRSIGAAVNCVSGCIFGFQLIDQEAKPLSSRTLKQIAPVIAPHTFDPVTR